MIAIIDLQNVLCLLFLRSWSLKKEFPEELTEVSVGDVLQHLYSVIVFGITQQTLPFSHYTGIPVLDQILIDDIFQVGEKSWFLQQSADHLQLANMEVLDCIVVGSCGVVFKKITEELFEEPDGLEI